MNYFCYYLTKLTKKAHSEDHLGFDYFFFILSYFFLLYREEGGLFHTIFLFNIVSFIHKINIDMIIQYMDTFFPHIAFLIIIDIYFF